MSMSISIAPPPWYTAGGPRCCAATLSFTLRNVTGGAVSA